MLWPNPDAGSDDISKAIRVFREQNQINFPIQFFKNIEPEDYVVILNNATCAIGNSSSFIREGSYLGTPAVLVGTRQQNREHGKNVKFASYSSKEIIKCVKEQMNHGRYQSEHIFGEGKAGKMIADIIAQKNPSVQKSFYQK